MRYLLALALLLNITASQARPKVLSPQQQFAKVLACYYEYEFNREHYNAAMAKAGYSKVIVTTYDTETTVKNTTDTMLYNDGFIVYEALESSYEKGGVHRLRFHYSNGMVDTVERYYIADSGRRISHSRYETDGMTYVNCSYFKNDTIEARIELQKNGVNYIGTEYIGEVKESAANVYVDTNYSQVWPIMPEGKWTIKTRATQTAFDYAGNMVLLHYEGSAPTAYSYKYYRGRLKKVTEYWKSNPRSPQRYKSYTDVTRYHYVFGHLKRVVKDRVSVPSIYFDPGGTLWRTQEVTTYKGGLPRSTTKYQTAPGKKLLKTVTYQYMP